MRHGISPTRRSSETTRRSPEAPPGANCGTPVPATSLNLPERITPELADLLRARETRLLMQADGVGMEQLVAALMRIQIPRRTRKSKAKRKAKETT